ncbi:hypothetical protein LJR219_004577 [Phenylobacterium sp. LjRoot219]|uniref:hypothetical protein n=1 Tax=Phenylobacterium sp. LjRoot219 TaxID=3342283 RepID=UPI003ECF364D
MSDGPKSDETPIERALRLKKAALEARPKAPGSGKHQREQSAAMPSGASKPWMKR